MSSNHSSRTRSRSRSRTRLANPRTLNGSCTGSTTTGVTAVDQTCGNEVTQSQSKTQTQTRQISLFDAQIYSQHDMQRTRSRSRPRSTTSVHATKTEGKQYEKTSTNSNIKQDTDAPAVRKRAVPPSPMPSFYSVPRTLPVPSSPTPSYTLPLFSFLSSPTATSSSSSQSIFSNTTRKRPASSSLPISSYGKKQKPSVSATVKQPIEDGQGNSGSGIASGSCSRTTHATGQRFRNLHPHSQHYIKQSRPTVPQYISHLNMPDVEIVAVSSSDDEDDQEIQIKSVQTYGAENTTLNAEITDVNEKSSLPEDIDKRPARRIQYYAGHRKTVNKANGESANFNDTNNGSGFHTTNSKSITVASSVHKIDVNETSIKETNTKTECVISTTAKEPTVTDYKFDSDTAKEKDVHSDSANVTGSLYDGDNGILDSEIMTEESASEFSDIVDTENQKIDSNTNSTSPLGASDAIKVSNVDGHGSQGSPCKISGYDESSLSHSGAIVPEPDKNNQDESILTETKSRDTGNEIESRQDKEFTGKDSDDENDDFEDALEELKEVKEEDNNNYVGKKAKRSWCVMT